MSELRVGCSRIFFHGKFWCHIWRDRKRGGGPVRHHASASAIWEGGHIKVENTYSFPRIEDAEAWVRGQVDILCTAIVDGEFTST